MIEKVIKRDGIIYGADAKNIYIVGIDGVNNRVPYKISEGFFVLSGMGVSSKGEVFLSNENSPKIYKFSNGQVSEFTKVSMPNPSRGGTVNGVWALSIDKNDHIFVLVQEDSGFTSIEEFGKDGKLIGTFGCSTPDVSGANILNYSPESLNSRSYFYSLLVTSEGYVALLETDPIDKNLVIKIFKKKS